MNQAELLAAIEALRTELRQSEGLDPVARQRMEALSDDIRQALATAPAAKSAGEDEPPLSDRATGIVEEFEVEHPQLTAAMNRIAAALANMGI